MKRTHDGYRIRKYGYQFHGQWRGMWGVTLERNAYGRPFMTAATLERLMMYLAARERRIAENRKAKLLREYNSEGGRERAIEMALRYARSY